MDREGVGGALGRDEVGYLAVAVAGNILDSAGAGGFLIEASDGNDRENLIDGP